MTQRHFATFRSRSNPELLEQVLQAGVEVGAALRWTPLDLLGVCLDESTACFLDRVQSARDGGSGDSFPAVVLAGEDAADPPVGKLGALLLVGLHVLDVRQLRGRSELAPPDAQVAVVDEDLVNGLP